MLKLSNFLLFQAGWFVCIFLGDFWAVGITLLIVTLHCYWVVRLSGKSIINELQWIFAVFCCGLLLESLYFGSVLLVRVDSVAFPPIWLLCVWVLFATTIRFSLAWLKPRLLLAAIFAAISAPLSYYAGASISPTVDLVQPATFGLFIVGLTWFIVFPMMLFFSSLNSQRVSIR